MARRLNMDLRSVKRFLAKAGVRSRQLPGLKPTWSVSHALEVIAQAEAEGNPNRGGDVAQTGRGRSRRQPPAE
jgi:hypothetical protein